MAPPNDDAPAPVRPAGGSRVPERPALEGLEERWSAIWEADGIYRFDPTRSREEIFSIDTPPPTVSGALHVGHTFSYTQTDVVARFQRMRGKSVFYPMGFDDNGLPTERRVQNYYGVRCDPNVTEPLEDLAALEAGRPKAKDTVAVSRPSFVELCRRLTAEDERAFEGLFRRLGLSVDWSLAYTTIGEASVRISQRSFLDLLDKGEVYRQEAPTLWDVDFATAVAQAELEDREVEGAYHRLAFGLAGDAAGRVEIETTRPELLPACVALVAHPDDERFQKLFDKNALTPLFGVEVPILAHRLADPEKGSGIAMVCTFGDLTDLTWWRELALATRTVVGRNGRLEAAPFGEAGWASRDAALARTHYAELEGKSVRQAQRRILELLAESGDLVGEARPIRHAVKYYEKGERPLEIVSSRQWYVRTIRRRAELLAAGRELDWHPPFMHARYEAWVEGLNGDWNISRQRYFGVPFPLWYPVLEDGSVDDAHPILASREDLPVDPSAQAPPGYDERQRAQPGGFVGDPDVMDTWATSSLTPQLAGRWQEHDGVFDAIFPMDLRPQAHEIIRTWLFTTVVRAELGHGELPWRHVAISGWILDPDRKKMSKSKGNVVVPIDLLETHGTDAVRYWASAARLGVDTVFDPQQMKIGRRLAIKILNAAKFALTLLEGGAPEVPSSLTALDEAMLRRLEEVRALATESLERFDHARALESVERFFWAFCDDYIELVKTRAYANEDGGSARSSLEVALSSLLRLFAPFLPFATEEAWSWWHDGSIHAARWPRAEELAALGGAGAPVDTALLDDVAAVLGEVRRAKTVAKRNMRWPVRRCVVRGDCARLERLALASEELSSAGSIQALELEPSAGDSAGDSAGELSIAVELADDEPTPT